jgi:hypothetical protein
MKLNELDYKQTAIKALKANFNYNFDVSKLTRGQTMDMLAKVHGLIKESKTYNDETNPKYLQLVFIEQALTEHYYNLKGAKIIVENAEVEKSQTILAAQDMVDSLQKMIEEVNDMLVKELPALTDSIQSEIGAAESQSFNQAASEALTTLNQTLSQSKQAVQGAMNAMTGQGSPGDLGAPPAGGGEEIAVTDVAATSAPAPAAAPAMPAELPPAEGPAAQVGRDKR